MLAVLRQRNFALLWLGNAISLLGNWILLVALPFYVYQQTGSALATGATFIVETIPTLLLGSFAGVFADRWDRRHILIATNLLQALFLMPLLTLQAHLIGLWIVYAVAVVESVLSQVGSPAFYALLPNLLDKDDQLPAANGALSVAAEATRLLGPTIGGALLGGLGMPAVVLADSCSFLVCALMVLGITNLPPRVQREQPARATRALALQALWQEWWQEWWLGVRLVGAEPMVRALFVVIGIAMLGEGTIRAVFVPFLSHIASGNALVFGWILTAQGAGGVLGSLLLSRASPLLRPVWLIALGASLSGLLVMTEAVFRTLLVVLVCSFLAGAAIVLLFVSVDTLLQQLVPDHFRGRIFGAYNTTSTVLLLVGMVGSSLLADWVGLFRLVAVGGALYVLAGVLAFPLLRQRTAHQQHNT